MQKDRNASLLLNKGKHKSVWQNGLNKQLNKKTSKRVNRPSCLSYNASSTNQTRHRLRLRNEMTCKPRLLARNSKENPNGERLNSALSRKLKLMLNGVPYKKPKPTHNDELKTWPRRIQNGERQNSALNRRHKLMLNDGLSKRHRLMLNAVRNRETKLMRNDVLRT